MEKLITAKEGREMIKPKKVDHTKVIKQLNDDILTDKHVGSLTVLSLHPEVVRMLERAGYKVKFNRACGMGDMDSHTITW